MNVNVQSQLGYQLLSLVRDNEHWISREMLPLDLSRTQWKVLVRFNFLPAPVGQQDLLKSVDIDRAHMTRTLDQLEERGLVTRERQKVDKRACYIALTASGKKLLAQIEILLEKHSELLVAGLTTDEQKALNSAIAKMSNNMSDALKAIV